MVDDTPPPDEPTPEPVTAKDMRLFVIELRDEDDAVVGYAVAERVAWIPKSVSATVYPTAQIVLQALDSLMSDARRQGGTMHSLPLPAVDDPAGGGSVAFMAGGFMASDVVAALLKKSKDDD